MLWCLVIIIIKSLEEVRCRYTFLAAEKIQAAAMGILMFYKKLLKFAILHFFRKGGGELFESGQKSGVLKKGVNLFM